jgi:hypothetical protein
MTLPDLIHPYTENGTQRFYHVSFDPFGRIQDGSQITYESLLSKKSAVPVLLTQTDIVRMDPVVRTFARGSHTPGREREQKRHEFAYDALRDIVERARSSAPSVTDIEPTHFSLDVLVKTEGIATEKERPYTFVPTVHLYVPAPVRLPESAVVRAHSVL